MRSSGQLSGFCVVLVLLSACGSGGTDRAPLGVTTSPATTHRDIDPVVAGRIPAGSPQAALLEETTITPPAASIWPFDTAIPKISGSGRYAHGAFYWADFLYDANGAQGQSQYNTGTPSGGGLMYPGTRPNGSGQDDKYDGNAADIFAIGIGADSNRSYWRVDWLTFVDPGAAIVAFGLDYDNNTATGTDGQQDDWPGVPRIRTAGIDAVLLISNAGVFLADSNGTRRLGSTFIVDSSQSMIAHVPVSELPALSGIWKIYALSGVHDGSGAFMDDMPAFQGRATDPPVFNAAFRDYDDELLLNNFWMNATQAQDLAGGDVGKFAIALEWDKLGTTEPEPRRVGAYSARWYVSSLDKEYFGRGGQWTGADSQGQNINHFDQIQPYGMYVPSDYDYDNPQPTTFTLLLHSFTQNYNQYSATVPNFLEETCETLRKSICLTTLGRGQAGGYINEAELDLWESAADIARDHFIDSERVYTSGYSMGANGSIRLLIKYPHVFAGGVVLAGSQSSEEGASSALGNVSGCFGEQQLRNILWNGYYHAHGSLDQLIPFNEARDTIDTIKSLGYRFTFDHYVAEDHVAWTLKDIGYPAFRHATEWLRDTAPQTRKANPGEIRYLFTPKDQHPEFNLGSYGAWWISGLQVADASDSPIAAQCADFGGRVTATSRAIPEQPYTPVFTGPTPAVLGPPPHDTGETAHNTEAQAWTLGSAPAAEPVLDLLLENVGRINVDMAAAALATGASTINIGSDSSFTLVLQGLDDGVGASVNGQLLANSTNGELVLSDLDAGQYAIDIE